MTLVNTKVCYRISYGCGFWFYVISEMSQKTYLYGFTYKLLRCVIGLPSQQNYVSRFRVS